VAALQAAQYRALESSIQKEILVSEAKKNHIKVSGSDINDQIKLIAQQYGMKDASEVKAQVIKSGQKWNDFRDLIRDDIMVFRLQQKLAASVIVDERVLKNLYKKVTARHILILTPPNAKNDKDEKEALAKLQKVKKDLQKFNNDPAQLSKKFGEYAMQLSQDPGSKDKGGILGAFGLGQMVPEFEQLAFALNAGEIGGPVKTNYGYHLILVEKVDDPGIPIEVDLKKLKEQTEQRMRQEKLTRWFASMRQNYPVQVFNPMMKAMQDLYQGNPQQSLLTFMQVQSQFQGVDGQIIVAQAYEAMGRFAEAQKEYAKAELLQKKAYKIDNPYLAFYRGVAYAKAKDMGNAKKYLNMAELHFKNNLILLSQLHQVYQNNKWTADANRVETLAKQIEASRKVSSQPEDVLKSLKVSTSNTTKK
jgi:parvulin-like peptidyl-prolyl isomerase